MRSVVHLFSFAIQRNSLFSTFFLDAPKPPEGGFRMIIVYDSLLALIVSDTAGAGIAPLIILIST